jgi:hypothetical protein
MNERLRELAMLANIEFTYDPTETPSRAFAECWEDELEKFAELIVSECLDIVNRKEYSYHEADPLWETSQLIKQHFGVKNDIT